MSTQNTQSTAKHTAGPWHFDRRPDSSVEIQDTNAIPVAVMTRRFQRNANARLIAAAPDLLEALEEVTALAYRLAMASPTLNPEVDRIIPNAQSAIARAKGNAAV